MSILVTPVSGLGPKEAAAFVVEARGRRLLLDLGADTDTGEPPDPVVIGQVDAVFISHAHGDHCGGLGLLGQIGNPPVYATESVLARLPCPVDGRPLPVRGVAEILGIGVATGRNGHALGGVWLRLDVGGGLLYMGDHTTESADIAFDPPLPSGAIIVDASYGNAEETRSAQVEDILRMSRAKPTLFPVPADGRGIEIALLFHRNGRRVAVDGAVRAALNRLAGPDGPFARPGAEEAAGRLAATACDATESFAGADVCVAAGATGDTGSAAALIDRAGAALDVIYTGYLPAGSRGAADVAAGRAAFRRWNVHPTLSGNAALVAGVKAATVIPAFGHARHALAWRHAFSPASVWVPPLIGPARIGPPILEL